MPARVVWAAVADALGGGAAEDDGGGLDVSLADDTLPMCRALLERANDSGSDAGSGRSGMAEAEELRELEAAVARGAATLTSELVKWGAQLAQAPRAIASAALDAAITHAGWGAPLARACARGEAAEVALEVARLVRSLARRRRWDALGVLLCVAWIEHDGRCERIERAATTAPDVSEVSVGGVIDAKADAGADADATADVDAADMVTAQLEDTVFGRGDFVPASEAIREHVLNTYLPRKVGLRHRSGTRFSPFVISRFAFCLVEIFVVTPPLSHHEVATYLGIAPGRLTDATSVRVPAAHGPEEGKIKGLWEQFATKRSGILDLRVDLQPPRLQLRSGDGAALEDGGHGDVAADVSEAGENAHYGSRRWANWAVQFGASKLCARSSRARRGLEASGAFAGVLMRTDASFRFGDLRTAMARSFEIGACVRLGVAAANVDPLGIANAIICGKDDIDMVGAHDDGDEARSAAVVMSAAGECDVGRAVAVEPPWRVFVDLDDTLADFSSAFRSLTGREPHDVSTPELWRRIARAPRFFEDLGWTEVHCDRDANLTFAARIFLRVSRRHALI